MLAEIPNDAREIKIVPLISLNNSNPFQAFEQTNSAVQFVTDDKQFPHPTVRWFVETYNNQVLLDIEISKITDEKLVVGMLCDLYAKEGYITDKRHYDIKYEKLL